MQHLLVTFIALAVFVVSTVSTVVVPATHVVHERQDSSSAPTSRWIKGSRVPGYSILPERVALTQSNLDVAHDHLLKISDPSLPDYGKHRTSEQVIDFFQPKDEAVKGVTQWLAENNINSVSHSDNKSWIAFDAPAATIEALLHTEYFQHQDTITGGVMPACEQYSVPVQIQEHIDFISPGIKLVGPMEVEAQGLMNTVLSQVCFPALLYNCSFCPPASLLPSPQHKEKK